METAPVRDDVQLQSTFPRQMHGHNRAKMHSNRYLMVGSCLSCTGSQRVSQHSDQLKNHFNILIANQRALMKAPQYRSGNSEKYGDETRNIEEIIEGLDEHEEFQQKTSRTAAGYQEMKRRQHL